MAKTLLTFFILIIFCSPVFPQDSAVSPRDLRKLNFDLVKKAVDIRKQHQSADVFVKGDAAAVESEVLRLGGHLKYAAGDISFVSIPVRSLSLLALKPFVKRLEARIPRIILTSDSMRIKSDVNPVFLGQSPLTQGYAGDDVVVGIIDTGIDYTNSDFKDSVTGATRVKFIWNQTSPRSSNTPVKYGYGQEWDSVGINSGIANGIASDDPTGGNHGTSTSGIAAGNGSHSPGHKYRGVAPAANLVVVALNFDTAYAGVITDAVDYIYGKAQLLGEPCVINLSLGELYGSHDGLDLQAQLMNNMISAQNGRAIVASAGNYGGEYYHLGYSLSASDTGFTWFNYAAAGSDSILEVWADTINFKNALFSIGADNITTGFSFRGNTAFLSVADNIGKLRTDTLYNALGNRIALVESNTSIQAATYDILFKVIPDSAIADYNWRLSLTGQGKFDLWSTEMISSGIPSTLHFPPIARYVLPDTQQTLLSSFQCLDNVIVVGNYDNKKTYIDILGQRQEPFPDILPGRIERNSSMGPTRDGRLKPDIAAPGSMTMATADLNYVAFWDTLNPTFVEQSGYIRAGGTSASSPVVAGISALYLQKNPEASAAQVRLAIIACPVTDSFTGSVPNLIWGRGKVDAFAALTECTAGINSLAASIVRFGIYPNPFRDEARIVYDFTQAPAYGSAEFILCDILGRVVRTIPLKDKAAQLSLQRGTLESGCYTCRLLMDGKTVQTNKLLLF